MQTTSQQTPGPHQDPEQELRRLRTEELAKLAAPKPLHRTSKEFLKLRALDSDGGDMAPPPVMGEKSNRSHLLKLGAAMTVVASAACIVLYIVLQPINMAMRLRFTKLEPPAPPVHVEVKSKNQPKALAVAVPISAPIVGGETPAATEQLILSHRLARIGQFQAAAAALLTAVKRFPTDEDLRVAAIRAQMRVRNYTTARQLCLEAIRACKTADNKRRFSHVLNSIPKF